MKVKTWTLWPLLLELLVPLKQLINGLPPEEELQHWASSLVVLQRAYDMKKTDFSSNV